jgi:hypothetical protein
VLWRIVFVLFPGVDSELAPVGHDLVDDKLVSDVVSNLRTSPNLSRVRVYPREGKDLRQTTFQRPPPPDRRRRRVEASELPSAYK